MTDHQLVPVSPARDAHRSGCTFGPGFYRVVLTDGGRRFCQSEGEVQFVSHLLPQGSVRRVQRDGYCLDGDVGGTPDVLSAERFLDMDRVDAMRELGLETEAEYVRTYRAVEDAVLERDRLHHGALERPSIVIKKKGRRVVDAA
jgi:hypothetical protein